MYIKLAVQKQMKMYNALSEEARALIRKMSPAGKTRLIPGARALGEGAEGVVWPSITGGITNETATKIFSPNVLDSIKKKVVNEGATKLLENKTVSSLLDRLPGKVKETLESAKKYTPVLRGIDGVPISERVALMRKYPTIFPKIYGENARGFTMETLHPLETEMLPAFYPPDSTNKTFLQKINDLPHYLRQKIFPPTATSEFIPSGRAAVADLDAEVRKLLQGERRAKDFTFRHNSIHPDKMPLLTGIPIDSQYRIRDVGVFPSFGKSPITSHNIMLTADGRAVIPDPLLLKRNLLSDAISDYPLEAYILTDMGTDFATNLLAKKILGG